MKHYVYCLFRRSGYKKEYLDNLTEAELKEFFYKESWDGYLGEPVLGDNCLVIPFDELSSYWNNDAVRQNEWYMYLVEFPIDL